MATWACLQTLGMQGMASSETIAADVMGQAFGASGERAISVLVASMNAAWIGVAVLASGSLLLFLRREAPA